MRTHLAEFGPVWHVAAFRRVATAHVAAPTVSNPSILQMSAISR